jgi:hypothetical protein
MRNNYKLIFSINIKLLTIVLKNEKNVMID